MRATHPARNCHPSARAFVERVGRDPFAPARAGRDERRELLRRALVPPREVLREHVEVETVDDADDEGAVEVRAQRLREAADGDLHLHERDEAEELRAERGATFGGRRRGRPRRPGEDC